MEACASKLDTSLQHDDTLPILPEEDFMSPGVLQKQDSLLPRPSSIGSSLCVRDPTLDDVYAEHFIARLKCVVQKRVTIFAHSILCFRVIIRTEGDKQLGRLSVPHGTSIIEYFLRAKIKFDDVH